MQTLDFSLPKTAGVGSKVCCLPEKWKTRGVTRVPTTNPKQYSPITDQGVPRKAWASFPGCPARRQLRHHVCRVPQQRQVVGRGRAPYARDGAALCSANGTSVDGLGAKLLLQRLEGGKSWGVAHILCRASMYACMCVCIYVYNVCTTFCVIMFLAHVIAIFIPCPSPVINPPPSPAVGAAVGQEVLLGSVRLPSALHVLNLWAPALPDRMAKTPSGQKALRADGVQGAPVSNHCPVLKSKVPKHPNPKWTSIRFRLSVNGLSCFRLPRHRPIGSWTMFHKLCTTSLVPLQSFSGSALSNLFWWHFPHSHTSTCETDVGTSLNHTRKDPLFH